MMTEPVSPQRMTSLPQEPIQQRVQHMVALLQAAYPDLGNGLAYDSPFEFLVSVILAAQASDAEVNQIAPTLLEVYPTVERLADADRHDVERLIAPIASARRKSKFLVLSSRIVRDEYGGEVPQEMRDLIRLPGVSRKSANLLLIELYDRVEGIATDNWVRRVVSRLDLAHGKSAEAIEQSLLRIVPRQHWRALSYQLSALGQERCHVRDPECHRCPLMNVCPSAEIGPTQH